MINLFLGFWQFFWVWGFGFALSRRLRNRLPYGYYCAVAFALGEIVLSYTCFLLGLMHGLRLGVLLPIAILLTLVSLYYWLLELPTLLKACETLLKQSPLSASVAGLILLFYLLAVCVPEREVDSLWYHLGVPFYYITHGGAIQLVPFNMPSHYPMNAHLHYCFSLLVGNDTTAKMFNYCHFFPLLILIASVVKRYVAKEWALFAVVIYLCCLHFRMPVMVNVQRAIYFYVFLSHVMLWYSIEKNNRLFFVLAAVFCGMGMGTKFNGLLFGFVPQFLFLLFHGLWRRKNAWRVELKWLVIYAAIAWLLMSPWLIKSFIYTGNPFYPMLEEIFPTHPDFVPAMQSNAHNHGLNLLKSHSVGEFAGQVWTNILWLLYNAYLLFFLGLLALFVMICLRKKRWHHPLIATCLAYGLFTLLWGSDVARLFGVNNTLIVLCITLVVAWLTPRIRYGQWLVAFIILSLVATFMRERYFYLHSPNINWFGQVVLSEEARREWLMERNIFPPDMYKMKFWIEQAVPHDDELYGYRTGYLFYMGRKYIVSGAHFKEQVDRWLKTSADEAAQRLHDLNVKWILTNRSNWDVKNQELELKWNEFLHRFLDPVRHEGDIYLYRLLSFEESIPWESTPQQEIDKPG